MTQTRPAFRHIPRPLDVSDEDLAKFSESRGVPALNNPAPKPPPAGPQLNQDAAIDPSRIPTGARTPTARKTAPAPTRVPATTRLSVKLPTYLTDAVNIRAAQERSTARHLVMQGLQAIGFHIEEADLTPDGRRSSLKRRRT